MLACDRLRVAAALAHSAPDADVELRGTAGRFVASYRRPDAALDPCALRRLALSAHNGTVVDIADVDTITFIGSLRDIGGGIYQRQEGVGVERRLATFLSATHVERLLANAPPDAGDGLRAHVRGDEGLGVTVVTLATDHPVFDYRLDVIAQWLMAACLVEELIVGLDREATP